MFLLLALRKEPPCIHTVCICCWFSRLSLFLMTLLLVVPTCTQATPTNASHVFIFYLALASRSFIPFDFFFFCTPILQPPSHKPHLNFKVLFMYEISFLDLFLIFPWRDLTEGRTKIRTPCTNATVLCISEVTGQTKKIEASEPRQFNSSFCSSQSSEVRAPR